MSGFLGDLSPDQERALRAMRDAMAVRFEGPLDPAISSHDNDRALLRFLRARSFDVEQASQMMDACLDWRLETNPQAIEFKDHVRDEFSLEKCLLLGNDREGRPGFVFLAGIHDPKLSPPNVCVDALVFAIEFLTSQRMEDDVESMSVVLDMAGYGYKNLDMDTVKAALVIVQEYYPERLGRAIFVNSPWVFKLIWKVIEPFVDEVTRRKIVFHSGPLEGLQEYFESDQLASTHGGTRNCSFEALISLFEADAESAGVGGPSAPEHAGDDFEPPPAYETLSPATTSTADALSVPDDGASVSADRSNSSQGRRRRRHRRRRPSTSRRLREAAEQSASKRLEGVAEEGTGGAAKGRPALRRDESSQSHTWWSDSDTDEEGKTAPAVVVIEPESDDDDAFVSAES